MCSKTISRINLLIFFSVDFKDLSIRLNVHVLLLLSLYFNVLGVIKKVLRFYEFKL